MKPIIKLLEKCLKFVESVSVLNKIVFYFFSAKICENSKGATAHVTFFSQNSAFLLFEPKEKGEKPDFKTTNRKTYGESSPVFGFEKEVF